MTAADGWCAPTFPTASRRLARSALDALAPYRLDDWTQWLITTLLMRPIRRDGRLHPPQGLPQGAPLSPLLCNTVLDRLDTALWNAGVPAVRYADDLTIAVPTMRDAAEAEVAVRQIMAQEGLRMSANKTSIVSFDEGFFLLGEEVGPAGSADELRKVALGNPPHTRTLYVTVDGSYVSVKKTQIVVTIDDKPVFITPIRTIGSIVLVGAVGLSAGARSSLLYNGIDVSFLSRRGAWLGRLESGKGHSAARRRSQYLAVGDPARCLSIARQLILGKTTNSRAASPAGTPKGPAVARRSCNGARRGGTPMPGCDIA
jgi:CRISP-associated protein Cas1